MEFTLTQLIAVAGASITITAVLLTALLPVKKERHYNLQVNRFVLKELFAEAMQTHIEEINDRFEPIVKAYEQAKKDVETLKAELAEALKPKRKARARKR